MTDRQRRALDELAEGPTKLPRATGEVLVRRGFARAERDRIYVVTEEGRRVAASLKFREEAKRLEFALSEDDRDLRKRALAWLEFNAQLAEPAVGHAKTVLAALIVGEKPPSAPNGWGSKGEETILEFASAALAAVVARDEAAEGSGQVETIFSEIYEGVSKGEAVAASTAGGIVSLDAYRRKRSA